MRLGGGWRRPVRAPTCFSCGGSRACPRPACTAATSAARTDTRTHGHTDTRTDRQTDRRTDGQKDGQRTRGDGDGGNPSFSELQTNANMETKETEGVQEAKSRGLGTKEWVKERGAEPAGW
eukprot:1790078-Rhodomonas_salina.5